MKRTIATLLLAACAGASLFGQKQPQPKSQKEIDAIMAIQNAADADARIVAAENLITKFADTEFKAFALYIAAESAREKKDMPKAIVYAERTLEADPKNVGAMLLLAEITASDMKEFDLDKAEKLARLDKQATAGLALVRDTPKPNPQIPDEQWNAEKQRMEAQFYQAMLKGAAVQKKYDPVIAKLQVASDSAPTNYLLMALLGQAYMQSGNADQAMTTLDKVIAGPADEQTKGFAQNVRAQAARAKSAPAPAKPSSAPANTTAPKP